jgi:hypothetical protein
MSVSNDILPVAVQVNQLQTITCGAIMIGYPTPKELDFLKKLADEKTHKGDLEKSRENYDRVKPLWNAGVRLQNAYRYLLWSYRYAHVDGKSIEHQVCYGFVVKYHRRLYNLEYSPGEKQLVERAEKLYAEHKRERTGNRQTNNDRERDSQPVSAAQSGVRQSRQRVQRRRTT